jgi:ribosomal protein S3AE
MATKTDKQTIRRRKFVNVEIPITRSKIEVIANEPKEVEGRTIKLDLTRQLKGKSIEMTVKIKLEKNKLVAYPIKINLLSYFIRRMIRKRISYVEDSFFTPSQESMILIKPFLITKRRVSRSVRKTLRNKTKNWLGDMLAGKTDDELFNEILSNRLQKSLSLYLKKTYPLSLCEIRIFEIIRNLKPEEVPKIEKKEKKELISEGLDQLQEIEDEKIKVAEKETEDTRIKEAEKEIKATQKKASKIEKDLKDQEKKSVEKIKKTEEKPKKTRKKKETIIEEK